MVRDATKNEPFVEDPSKENVRQKNAATRPHKGGKGTAPSEVVVQRLTAEPHNKQTYRPVQLREFVEFLATI